MHYAHYYETENRGVCNLAKLQDYWLLVYSHWYMYIHSRAADTNPAIMKAMHQPHGNNWQ